MNDRDGIPAVPKRQQSHDDLVENNDEGYKDAMTITREIPIRSRGVETSNPLLKHISAKLGLHHNEFPVEAHSGRMHERKNLPPKPPSANQQWKRTITSRRKSSPSLTNKPWCSLPTIAEHHTSLFEKEFTYKSSPSLNRKGTQFGTMNWKNIGSSSTAPKSVGGTSNNFQFVEGKARSSLPSQGTTLFLLQDLQLSKEKRRSLKTTLQRTSSPAKRSDKKPRGDFILSPPARISSNALLHIPSAEDTSSSTMSSPRPSPRQKSQDRFKSIVSISPEDQPFKDARTHSPKLPARRSSPNRMEQYAKKQR
jgi:hypothetical protein